MIELIFFPSYETIEQKLNQGGNAEQREPSETIQNKENPLKQFEIVWLIIVWIFFLMCSLSHLVSLVVEKSSDANIDSIYWLPPDSAMQNDK